MQKKQEKQERSIFTAHLKLALLTIIVPSVILLAIFIFMQIFEVFYTLMRTPFFPESGFELTRYFFSPFGFMLMLTALGVLIAGVMMIRAGMIQKRKTDTKLREVKTRVQKRQFLTTDAGNSDYYSVSNGLVMLGDSRMPESGKTNAPAHIVKEVAMERRIVLPSGIHCETIGEKKPARSAGAKSKEIFFGRNYGDDIGCVG